MTTEHVYKHKTTRQSSEAWKKVCRGCMSSRGTLLSYYEVDGKPKVFAFCTKQCATKFRKDNSEKKKK